MNKKLGIGLILCSLLVVSCSEPQSTEVDKNKNLTVTQQNGDVVTISRSGNKIYVGRKPDQVYPFAKRAVSHFGLKISNEDANLRLLNTEVTNTTALNRYGAANVDFVVTEENGNSVINVLARIQGKYDQARSEKAAASIVDQIIAYLNGFARSK